VGLLPKSGAPWLVYGRLTHDGLFTALDGRKYPADRAVAIEQPYGRRDDVPSHEA
jgi:hypothetical protein